MTTAHAEELAQLRADAARERDELRAALESRAQVLEESRGELRARAERAERDLDAARAELARVRQERRDDGRPGRGEAAALRSGSDRLSNGATRCPSAAEFSVRRLRLAGARVSLPALGTSADLQAIGAGEVQRSARYAPVRSAPVRFAPARSRRGEVRVGGGPRR